MMATHSSTPSGTMHTLMAWALACAFAILAFAAVMGILHSTLAAVLAALGVAALAACLLLRYPILRLDEQASSPALNVLAVAATIVALLQLVRLCVFIVNPAAVSFAIGPSRGLGLPSRHSCVSAYFVAARAVVTQPNVYSWDLYSFPDENPTSERKPRSIATFNVDAYEYPPPFLLLPRTLALLTPDFLRFRMLWFALNGGVLLISLPLVAKALGPALGTRAALLAPLVLASDIPVGTLQVGNLQAIIVSLAMIAMLLLARRRYLAGGALLAFATVSKLFPGVLIVYLLVQRKWRALAWTSGACIVLVAVSLADTGLAPYKAFLHHLPGLLRGDTFPALRRPGSVALNYSIPGMVLKLRLFGFAGSLSGAMSLAGWIYSLLLLAVTVAVAKRPFPRGQQPLAWLALLILASLRSPFLPAYALIPVLWLLTLLAATAPPSLRTLCRVLLAWGILNIVLPVFTGDPRPRAIFLLLPQAILALLLVLALRIRPGPMDRTSGTAGSLDRAGA